MSLKFNDLYFIHTRAGDYTDNIVPITQNSNNYRVNVCIEPETAAYVRLIITQANGVVLPEREMPLNIDKYVYDEVEYDMYTYQLMQADTSFSTGIQCTYRLTFALYDYDGVVSYLPTQTITMLSSPKAKIIDKDVTIVDSVAKQLNNVTRVTTDIKNNNEELTEIVNRVDETVQTVEADLMLLDDSKLDKASSSSNRARVYAVATSGTQYMHTVSNGDEAWKNAIPKYNENGNLCVEYPDDNKHAANKQYVDNVTGSKVSRLTNKLNALYAVDSNGSDTGVQYSNTNIGDTVAQRDSNGNISVSYMPQELSHATCKYYVDNAIDNLSNLTDTDITDLRAIVNANGYNIETIKNDYASINYVNDAISNISGSGLTTKIVNSVSNVNEAGVLYLIKSGTGSNDSYDEYLYIDGKAEKIGSTAVDISSKLDKVTSTDSFDRLYSVSKTGQQSTIRVDTNVSAIGAVVRRNGLQIKVPDTPQSNDDATSKKYVDTKLSINNTIDTNDRVYTVDLNGNQTLTRVSNISTADTLAKRNNNGCISVNTPTTDDEAANKGYVDSKLATVLPQVTSENNGAFLRVVNGSWGTSIIASAEGVGF